MNHPALSFGILMSVCLGACATSSSAERRVNPDHLRDAPTVLFDVDENSACAAHNDTQVTCWGDYLFDSGKTVTVSIEKSVETLSYDEHRLCVTDTDARLHCWQSDELPNTEFHQRKNGSVVPKQWKQASVREVALGDGHMCVMKDDRRVQCTGRGDAALLGQAGHGQAVPPDAEFVQISAERNRTCGVTTDHRLLCWGKHLPHVEFPENGPKRFTGEFAEVAVGGFTVCGLTREGRVKCWGLGADPDFYEAVGDFDQGIAPDGRYSHITVGRHHACGVTLSDELRCWGLGSSEALFEGEHDYDQAVPTVSTASAVYVGDYHSCAAHGDGIVCWGAGVHPESSDQSVREGHGQSRVPSGLQPSQRENGGGDE